MALVAITLIDGQFKVSFYFFYLCGSPHETTYCTRTARTN
jgi:hypothetical protein